MVTPQSTATVSRLGPIMRRLEVWDVVNCTCPAESLNARAGRSGMWLSSHRSVVQSNTVCSGPIGWTVSPHSYAWAAGTAAVAATAITTHTAQRGARRDHLDATLHIGGTSRLRDPAARLYNRWTAMGSALTTMYPKLCHSGGDPLHGQGYCEVISVLPRPRPSSHPVDVGLRTEATILSELLKRGYQILVPQGQNQRYDLVLDVDGSFLRVQCKTGRLRNGCIEFSARSVRD